MNDLDYIRKYKGCSICGWKEWTCAVHHIIQKNEKEKYLRVIDLLGGIESKANLIVLCPNHHILADNKQIDIVSLVENAIEPISVDTIINIQCVEEYREEHGFLL